MSALTHDVGDGWREWTEAKTTALFYRATSSGKLWTARTCDGVVVIEDVRRSKAIDALRAIPPKDLP